MTLYMRRNPVPGRASPVIGLSLTVNSPSNQVNVPFVCTAGGICTPIAYCFPKAKVTGNLTVSGIGTLHVVVLAKWNDGSLKHVAIVGTWSPSAGDNVIDLVANTDPGGSPPTISLPSDPVVLGGTTLNLNTATLHRTWFSTPDMIEKHYRAKTGTRYVWWYVRKWSNGSVWIGRKIENNRNDDNVTGGTDGYTNHTDAVSAGSYANASLSHDPYSAWFAESWQTGSDPGTYHKHDVLNLQRSKLVPNWIRRPNGTDEDRTNAYAYAAQTYSVLGRGNHRQDWTIGGYWPQLGVLTKWESVMAKYADSRGMAWGKVHGLMLNSFSIVVRNTSHEPPLCTEIGVRGSPVDSFGVNGFIWDAAHNANSAYVPYLLTADFRFFETMQTHCAAMVDLISIGGANSATRGLENDLRHKGLRTLGQTVAAAPTEMGNSAINAWRTEYQTLLASQCSYLYQNGTTPNPYFHIPDSSGPTGAPYNNLGITPGRIGGIGGAHAGEGNIFGGGFIPGYLIVICGHLLDIECLSDSDRASKLLPLMQFASKYVVDRLGAGGTGSYPWDDIMQDPLNTGGYLRLASADDGTQTFTYGYANWGAVYLANFGSARVAGTAMKAFATGGPTDAASIHDSTVYQSDGSWVLPAASYAADYGVTGADAALARVLNASNFAAFGGDNVANFNPDFSENVGYGATPDWGIAPRSWTDGHP